MTERKFLFQVKKVKKKKMKPIIYLIIEKGFTVSDEIVNMFKNFVLKKEQKEINHNPISILKLFRDKWKRQELTNKKGDILICLVNQYYSLYGFKELLKSRKNKDENLEFYDLPNNNHIFICYSKGKKKSDLLSKNLRKLSCIEEEDFDKNIINQINLSNLDSDYTNLQ